MCVFDHEDGLPSAAELRATRDGGWVPAEVVDAVADALEAGEQRADWRRGVV